MLYEELSFYGAVVGLGWAVNLFTLIMFAILVIRKYGVIAPKRKAKRGNGLFIPYYSLFKFVFYIYPRLKMADSFDEFHDVMCKDGLVKFKKEGE